MQIAISRAPALPRAAAARDAASRGGLRPALALAPRGGRGGCSAVAAPSPPARAPAAAKPKPKRGALAVRAAVTTERANQGSPSSDGAAAAAAAPTPAAAAVASLQSLPDLWPWLAAQHGDAPAVEDRHRSPHVAYSFRELASEVEAFGAGLAALGVRPDDRCA